VFGDLEDFNDQLKAWQAEIADLREHGTTHEPPIVRFAREAAALMPLAGRVGFLAALPRSRVVASDWLVSIDANRYSGPWRATLARATPPSARDWPPKSRGLASRPLRWSSSAPRRTWEDYRRRLTRQSLLCGRTRKQRDRLQFDGVDSKSNCY